MDATHASSKNNLPCELKDPSVRNTRSGSTDKLGPGSFSDNSSIRSRRKQRRNSLSDKRPQYEYHGPLLPTMDLPLCSALSESIDSTTTWIGDTTPTKSLRKGLKAHRRVATIPTVLLSDSETIDFFELESHRPMENEFGIRVKVLDRVDLESDSFERLPLSLRSMRDGLRKAIIRRLIRA